MGFSWVYIVPEILGVRVPWWVKVVNQVWGVEGRVGKISQGGP